MLIRAGGVARVIAWCVLLVSYFIAGIIPTSSAHNGTEQKPGRDRASGAQPGRDGETNTEIQRFVKHQHGTFLQVCHVIDTGAGENGTAPSDWFLPSDISWFYMESWSQGSSIRSTQFFHMHARSSKGPMMSLMQTGKQCLTKEATFYLYLSLSKGSPPPPEIGRHFHELCKLYELTTKNCCQWFFCLS